MALKIGILTLPITENYGGILQSLALYKFLDAEGHDVVLIYKDTYQDFWKKTAIKILLNIPFHNFKNIKSKNILKLERKKFHSPFIKKEIFKISKCLYTKQELEDYAKQESFDVVIVGSDQVWRKAYINDKYYKSYFLDFVSCSKTKKLAYAASFGKDYWEGQDDSEDITKLLQDFAAVSVREVSGVGICKKSFNYDKAEHVLDPAMLMGKEFYKSDIIEKYNDSNNKEGGLLTYVLDEAKEKKEIIEFVQKSVNNQNIHHLKGFGNSDIIFSVPEWLASFANADFVVTDSFHGMVFSIIFEKEFVVIGNSKRGLDRFISLLSLLGIEDRLVFDVKALKDKGVGNIDYCRVNELLDKEKKKSLMFLMEALNGE